MSKVFRFSFFLICDARDQLDFHIESTTMQNPRLRYSAMKSKFKRWCNLDEDDPEEEQVYYRIFKNGYETYQIIEKRDMTRKEATFHKKLLTEERIKRYKKLRN